MRPTLPPPVGLVPAVPARVCARYGFTDQEAPEAHAQEEASQDAQGDPLPTARRRQVGHPPGWPLVFSEPTPFGDRPTGRTSVFGTENWGSNPCPRASFFGHEWPHRGHS